jgi:hypothetical protein
MNKVPQFSERSFGFSVGGVCAALSAFSAWRGHEGTALWSGIIGGGLILAAAAWPPLLTVPARWWSRVAFVLGWINGRILLSLVFFLFITPIGLLLRLFGQDPLARRPGRGGWTPYPQRLRNPAHYERMF